jgi:hypothetical protein
LGWGSRDAAHLRGAKTISHKAKLGVALLALSVFALPVATTLTLKDQGEKGVEAERHLQSGLTELRIQDALEWRPSAAVCRCRTSARSSPTRVSAPELS